VTQGTSSASIIFVATVVLPDADPPHIPKREIKSKELKVKDVHLKGVIVNDVLAYQ